MNNTRITKDIITREQALAIAPDYVKFSEDLNSSTFNSVMQKFNVLRKGQPAITYVDGQFVKVRVTSINHEDFRAIDGPVVRVGNGEYTWRVDGDGYAYPI
ncbi:MAG: hypothetical protein WC390_10295 [Sulfurimonas sp.]|jgi:hypothetical protein